MPELPLITRAKSYENRPAIHAKGIDHSYADLLKASAALAKQLLGNSPDLAEARIAFMAPAGFDYFAIQWAIWRAGGVALPLSSSATLPELQHAVTDCGASHVVTVGSNIEKLAPLCAVGGPQLVDFGEVPPCEPEASFPEIEPSRRAMILYTSGTTSRPKGVVTTHANIQAQIETLVDAWEWSKDDTIPLFLPMHHIHGIINISSCALWCGAKLEAFSRFEMSTILDRVAAGAYSVFMAVPTIYVKLIERLESDRIDSPSQRAILDGFAKMRLMVSGSAALPPSVHLKWTSLTGQHLLERYGMTETGMMIANPLHGERRPGAVGQPLPTVQIRLKAEKGAGPVNPGEPGEIQVKGPIVFSEYWNLPEVTEASFDDGWFRTGDMAVMEDDYYRIMGRLSTDIIKSGGYKLSALEIEAALLEHPGIRECAVIGIPDDTWGEMVAAVLSFENSEDPISLQALHSWGKDRLSPYKLPRKISIVEQLPRNAMGKVPKPQLKELFQ